MDESQSDRDGRIEELWRKLDSKKQGHLDKNDLKEGLQTINHPLKDADSLLDDVLKAVDTDGDGRIQYREFRTFVETTERELWQLFKSIDRDHDGKLDKKELALAFKNAGLIIPKTRLDRFFAEVDLNHDGTISFDEWRKFLIFMPAHAELKSVLSYYTSTVTFNSEGDVHVSSDTSQGLGRIPFLKSLFAIPLAIFRPIRQDSLSAGKTSYIPPPTTSIPSLQPQAPSPGSAFPWDPGDQQSLSPINGPIPEAKETGVEKMTLEAQIAGDLGGNLTKPVHLMDQAILEQPLQIARTRLLTDLLPPSGYFIAGGIAGMTSRTATAPLDRLKVYLIAQTDVKKETVQAVKSGDPVKASKLVSRPLVEASRAIWRMGGIRSLFAGNGLNVVKVMPESAIKFGSYEASKRTMARLEGHDDPKNLHPTSQFIAGGLGGIISQFCIYPLDTLKFRMQCETIEGGLRGNALIIGTAKKMWAHSGIRSFYRGLPMGLVGMFPYSAVDLSTFEYLKKTATKRSAAKLGIESSDEKAAPGNMMTAAIGAFSGAFGASIVYPLNLLRTRLQSQGTAIHPPTYTGMWDVTVKTVEGEGFRGLFRGITPNLLKVVPAVSITYVVYDNSKRLLGLS
ncbi:hypothetical protein MMC25_005635 [Agyrium rufum]|nr:hypothetical protein [Agyrium rufum]